MSIWEVIKEVIHLLYEISGVALGIGLYITIKQLKLLQKDMEIRSKRAAAEKSIEYLHTYAEKVLSSGHEKYIQNLRKNKEDDNLKINGSNFFYKHYDNDGFELNIIDRNSDEFQDGIWRTKSGLISVLNHLELYSISMIHGVADEKIAFTPTSDHFCTFIKDNYTGLIIARQRNIPFENVVKLFEIWDSRMKVDALEKKQLELQMEQETARWIAEGLSEQSKGVTHI